LRIASVAVVTGFLLLVLASQALALIDVTPSHPNYDAIETLSAEGVITGYPDSTFRPESPIWRAQFAKMTVKLFGLPASEHHVCPFYDVEVSGAGSLYPDNYVAVAAYSGITKGTTATRFSPYKDSTRQQALTMLVRAADTFYPGLLRTPPASWQGTMPGALDPDHGANIRKAEYNGLLAELDPSALDPWAPATRAEVAQVMANLQRILPPSMVEPFDVALSMAHTRYLADRIGVRRGGADGERRAGDYLAVSLSQLGYEPRFQTFPLTTGDQSRNVIATLEGRRADTLVIGGHYDTKSPSPGANDNGTGVGAILELARVLKDEALDFTVKFVLFGTEEIIDSDLNHHHFGSRYYVASLSPEERAMTKAMINVDMIGYGPEFRVRTMGMGKQSLRDALLSLARGRGVNLTYLKDTGSSGWSDHEPFELAGIPAAWIEWRDDPQIHTSNDVSSRVDAKKVRLAGQLVLDYVRALDLAKLNALASY
jgi:hypothetical protein